MSLVRSVVNAFEDNCTTRERARECALDVKLEGEEMGNVERYQCLRVTTNSDRLLEREIKHKIQKIQEGGKIWGALKKLCRVKMMFEKCYDSSSSVRVKNMGDECP